MNSWLGVLMARPNRHPEQKVIFCYAEGCADRWEAFCLNFDLAVQGDSFESVRAKLAEALDVYLEGVMALPEQDRKRLLNRRAPFLAWLGPFLRTLKAAFTKRDDRLRHEYTLPSPAAAMA